MNYRLGVKRMNTDIVKQDGTKDNILGKAAKTGKGFAWGTLIGRFAIILFVITVVLPLIWTVVTSLKSTLEFYTNPFGIPRVLRFDNYARAWVEANVGVYFFNSVIITLVTVAVNVALCAMAAYVLARYKFFGNKFLTNLFLAGLMVPQIFMTVPSFILLVKLSLIDSWPGLIIIMLTHLFPFAIFLLIGFFETLPNEIEESARIDGANDFQTFFRIMFPLAKAGWVTILIFDFISVWNNYIDPLVYLTTEAKRTLPVGLVNLSSVAQYKSDWGALFAGLVIVMIPSLLVYALFSEQLIQGMTAASVKG
jgi:ABC-type sugar transport system, permease component